ncbi:MAG: sarcosine oxidase subunit alpha family protein [Kiloniellales bacterium]
MTATRLPTGGWIDRSQSLTVTFDGKPLNAHPGDTLASALLANDVSLVGRSFKYHRPRGIYSAGAEEPNALVTLREGARSEPNTRATQIEVFDGLTARPQNARPSLRWDLGALNQLLSPAIHAGFYYKTFIGPFRGTGFWMRCERFIRKAAGMGEAERKADPDSYEKVNAFADLLVVGSGPAGLCAALAAGRTGARVLLVEQDWQLGGSLLSAPRDRSEAWLQEIERELRSLENVTLLSRTTVFGAYDHDVYGAVERVWDHVEVPPDGQPRQRYWQIRAKQAILATGALEQPLVFAGNDRPGVMLAGAVRAYLNRFAVRAGRQILVATNNDSAYATALDLAEAGSEVTLLDSRAEVPASLTGPLTERGVKVMCAHTVFAARGHERVGGAAIAAVGPDGQALGALDWVTCDLIAVSGGWAPALHLWSQRQQKPRYDSTKACFLPEGGWVETQGCIGAAAGIGGTTAAFAAGLESGGLTPSDAPSLSDAGLGDDWTRSPQQQIPFTGITGRPAGKAFIDLQHDVTISDIDLAEQEGYRSVEHLKRYTTSGMATDQGKTSNLNALARIAQLRGTTIGEAGTTTFRPPYTPVAIGALVGRDCGLHFRPIRRTAIHEWHEANGAVMTEAGPWMRPWYYPQAGEEVTQAYRREAAHVRAQVGLVDVSTLGKIAVQGPDAAAFLNRIYVNGWKTLAVGRLRYGIMLRDDGLVMDDGATARLGEHDYFMSTTTANAAKVLAFAEELLQTAWTDLRVQVTSVTDAWAAFALAGPKARDVLGSLAPGSDLSAEALPNNHWIAADIAGVALRIHRMSYSGELAYEVYCPSGYGRKVWEAILGAGGSFDLRPYGTEAMGALRIEKGHVAGPELDGRTTLADLCLAGFASKKKPFVGSVLKNRPLLQDPLRPTLVGLEIEGERGAKPGSLLFAAEGPTEGHGEGWVSSPTYSPALAKNIALGFLKNGPQRKGETVRIVDFLSDTTLRAKVVSHHFFDPEGARQNG